MSKVKPLLPGPVAVARRVLDECDVRHPRDIDVEYIAARKGAHLVYGRVDTAQGVIARTTAHAIIRVDEQAKGQPRADFIGAHELGHHLMHELIDHFAQCKGDEGAPARGSREAREESAKVRHVEREANHFATELRMPEKWAAPLCAVARPDLEDVHRLARAFRASFHTSALRFIELTSAPCAFVHTVGGRIKRSTETETFPGRIVQRRDVHPHSVAARVQGQRGQGDAQPQEVPGAAWGDAGGRGFVEHAIALGPELGVMSWIVAID